MSRQTAIPCPSWCTESHREVRAHASDPLGRIPLYEDGRWDPHASDLLGIVHSRDDDESISVSLWQDDEPGADVEVMVGSVIISAAAAGVLAQALLRAGTWIACPEVAEKLEAGDVHAAAGALLDSLA
ncbi:MAG TPA: hypothetical protein VFI40_15710 [Nocardioides sp.]|nr:hypothetical protein [Nocardioides sp.]